MLPAIQVLQATGRSHKHPGLEALRPVAHLSNLDADDLTLPELEFLQKHGITEEDFPSLIKPMRKGRRKRGPSARQREEMMREKLAEDRRERQRALLRKHNEERKRAREEANAQRRQELRAERSRRVKATRKLDRKNARMIEKIDAANRERKAKEAAEEAAKEELKQKLLKKMLKKYESGTPAARAIEYEEMKRQKAEEDKKIAAERKVARDKEMAYQLELEEKMRKELEEKEEKEAKEREEKRKRRDRARRKKQILKKKQRKFYQDTQKMMAKYFDKQLDLTTNNGVRDEQWHEQAGGAKFAQSFRSLNGIKDGQEVSPVALWRAANVIVRATSRFQRTYRMRRRARKYRKQHPDGFGTSIADAVLEVQAQARETLARKREAEKKAHPHHTEDAMGHRSYDMLHEYTSKPEGYAMFQRWTDTARSLL